MPTGPQAKTVRIATDFGFSPRLKEAIARNVEKTAGKAVQLSMFPQELEEIEIEFADVENVRRVIKELFEERGVGTELKGDVLRIVRIPDDEDIKPRRKIGRYDSVMPPAM